MNHASDFFAIVFSMAFWGCFMLIARKWIRSSGGTETRDDR